MEGDSSQEALLTKYKYPLVMGFVGLVLLIGGVVSSGVIPRTFESKRVISSKDSPTVIKVDVSGSVTHPGVYTLSSGARIEDAIKAAGGLSETADPEYLSKAINLAQKLTDGTKVYVPTNSVNSIQVSPQIAGVSAQRSDASININNATLTELDTLPGVGQITAQKIIDGRPYQEIGELLGRKVITRSIFEKIKDRLVVY